MGKNVRNVSLNNLRTTRWAIKNYTVLRQCKPLPRHLTLTKSDLAFESGSFDKCRMAPSGRRPKNKPDDLGCESACIGCQKLHPPSPFIIITQPESWYSFYRPTESRRLSRPSWLVTYRDGLPVHRRSPIQVLTGSDVAQLSWSRPTRYHSAKQPTFNLD